MSWIRLHENLKKKEMTRLITRLIVFLNKDGSGNYGEEVIEQAAKNVELEVNRGTPNVFENWDQ